ncbi:MAG: signal peptidase I [Thermodesulfobacteriota bacterium]
MGRLSAARSAADANTNGRAATKTKSTLREYAEAIGLAVLLALFIRTFVVQAFKIPSGSMLPTLQIGDHILVVKSIYGVRLPFINKVLIPVKEPQRDDVIVFIYPVDPDKDFIKRVVGVPGDKIEVRNKKLYLNDQPVKNDHGFYEDPELYPTTVKPRDDFGPVKIPPHKLFVMGDNRDHSYDSRFWGFVDYDAVKGKAWFIYWSWDADRWRLRWNRLFKTVD